MKKSDLKTGMMIQLRNGAFAIVLLGTERGDIFSMEGDTAQAHNKQRTWGPMDSFDEEMNFVSSVYKDKIPEGDIVVVYSIGESNSNALTGSTSSFYRNVLWRRDHEAAIPEPSEGKAIDDLPF